MTSRSNASDAKLWAAAAPSLANVTTKPSRRSRALRYMRASSSSSTMSARRAADSLPSRSERRRPGTDMRQGEEHASYGPEGAEGRGRAGLEGRRAKDEGGRSRSTVEGAIRVKRLKG